MKMSELEEHAKKCLMNNLPLQVMVSLGDYQSPELITNPPENITKKMIYYKATYDENCNHRHVDNISILGIVHSSEELKDGEATLLPYISPLLENHVRVEDRCTVEAREKQMIVEGEVEDVIKILQYFETRKVEELND